MKRGGLKRKIPIEKRETKQQRSVACNKRRRTIFSKSADLCRFSGANIAVFVTSPAENSDVVYSFSGYSTANVIVDCYFNGTPLPSKKINPQADQAKLGFLWDDPDLYRNCDDLSELSFIEDRLEKLKKDVVECLEKKERLQLACSDQNPNFSSLDQIYGEPFSSLVNQNPNFSFDQINGEPCSALVDQNPNFFIEEMLRESFGFENGTEEENNALSLTHETKTELMIDFDEQSFWDNQFNDDVLGVKSDFNLDDNNYQDLFVIREFLNEEEIEY